MNKKEREIVELALASLDEGDISASRKTLRDLLSRDSKGRRNAKGWRTRQERRRERLIPSGRPQQPPS